MQHAEKEICSTPQNSAGLRVLVCSKRVWKMNQFPKGRLCVFLLSAFGLGTHTHPHYFKESFPHADLLMILFVCRTKTLIRSQRSGGITLRRRWDLRAAPSVTTTSANTRCLLKLCSRAEGSETSGRLESATRVAVWMRSGHVQAPSFFFFSSPQVSCRRTAVWFWIRRARHVQRWRQWWSLSVTETFRATVAFLLVLCVSCLLWGGGGAEKGKERKNTKENKSKLF